MTGPVAVSGGLRTDAEKLEAPRNRACFEQNPESWETKIENFPKYVRRQNLTRFLALNEIFKRIIPVKGSIVECGVNRGFGVMTWAKLSAIYEPVNLMRKVYGFDTFSGFPSVAEKDTAHSTGAIRTGDLAASSYEEILELSAASDSTRFLGHVPKVELIKGDATKTIPEFVETHPHLVVSLLYLDFDLYEPTKVALEHFVPRMPKGAIIAFDELDNALWPGETLAMLEAFKARPLKLERLPFEPYIGFAEIE